MSDSHNCHALVLTCIDFRFHSQIADLLREFGHEVFDLKTDAGSVKYLISQDKPHVRDWILENIDIGLRLHNIQNVVLINHYDCGAYGGNAAFDSDQSQLEYQKGQLTEAKILLGSKFPDLKVTTYFAEMNSGKVNLLLV